MKCDRIRRKLAILAVISTGTAFQLTACFGSDPQFFFTSSITNTVISTIVGYLFNAVLTGVTA